MSDLGEPDKHSRRALFAAAGVAIGAGVLVAEPARADPTYIEQSEKGAANGVATLDANGHLVVGQTDHTLSTIQADPASALRGAQRDLPGAVINVQDHGLEPGVDSPATAAAWSSIVSLINTSTNRRAVYFPGHDDPYIIAGGVGLFTAPVAVYGDDLGSSKIQQRAGTTGDLFTFRARSRFENLFVDGNKANGATGDLVVLDAGYCRVSGALLANAGGTALRVGKAAKAIVTKLSDLQIRTSRDWGILVQQDSTDGLWSNLDVGTSGLSGVRLEASSQNLSNVHSWGNGAAMNDTAGNGDGSGFYVTTSGHQFSGCQGETNWEDGFTFRANDQNGSLLAACKAWANGLAGLALFGYSRLRVAASSFYDNSLRNGDPAYTGSALRFSGIYNFESNHLTATGNGCFDRSVARVTVSPNPVMSKSATVTQVGDYQEEASAPGNNPSNGAFSGNSFLRAGGVVFAGNGSAFEGNRVNNTSVPSIAIAGTTTVLPIKAHHKVVSVTGAGSFNSLGVDSLIGRTVTLVFADADISVFTMGTIKLASAFVSTAGKQLTLQWNGSKWVELSRTV